MRGRAGRRVFIAVLVLLGLAVAADRVGMYVAERVAADTIERSQHLASRPDVDIGGFPFLTQLATGKYDEVTVTAHDVVVDESADRIRISTIRVVLHSLTVSRDFSSVRAERASATAVIEFAELSRTLGVDVGYAGGGRIRATKSLDIAAQSVTATVTARPRLVNSSLTFDSLRINGSGSLGAAVTAAIGDAFAVSIPLRDIPFDVQVRSVRVDPRGIVIGLTGSNLFYTR